MVKLITPEVWGEDAWRIMHVVALGFPKHPTETDKKNYADFYKTLTQVLPCERCRQGYQKFMEARPIDVSSMENLFQWTVDIHNDVNRKLSHDIMDPTWIRTVYVFRDHEKPILSKNSSKLQIILSAATAFLLLGLIVVILNNNHFNSPKRR